MSGNLGLGRLGVKGRSSATGSPRLSITITAPSAAALTSSEVRMCRSRTEAFCMCYIVALVTALLVLVSDLTAHDRIYDCRGKYLIVGNRQDVAREHGDIRQLSRLQRSLDLLLEGGPLWAQLDSLGGGGVARSLVGQDGRFLFVTAPAGTYTLRVV